jgi:hypothetical protein
VDALPWWQVPVGWWVCYPSTRPFGAWYRFDGWGYRQHGDVAMLSGQPVAVSPFDIVIIAPPALIELISTFGAEILEVPE